MPKIIVRNIKLILICFLCVVAISSCYVYANYSNNKQHNKSAELFDEFMPIELDTEFTVNDHGIKFRFKNGILHGGDKPAIELIVFSLKNVHILFFARKNIFALKIPTPSKHS